MDSLNPEYNLRPTAESLAGMMYEKSSNRGIKKPEGFGDKLRKAQGTPIYLYDNNHSLLFIFDSLTLAYTTLMIGERRLNSLLNPLKGKTKPLSYGYVSLIAISPNHVPSQTLAQVEQLVE